jgi:2'-5' RNA ligase
MDHYADTGRAVADVTIGEDRHGIWVAGKLRPGVSDADVATLRGSALSGDWRPIGGNLELAGILAVNNPGFLVDRHEALAASLITVGPCDCEMDGMVAASGNFSGAVVTAVPTAEDAERLAQPGFEDADDLHVTLAWMGPASELDATSREAVLDELTAITEGQMAFTGNAFAHAVFNPLGDEPASVLLVQSTEITQLRNTVAEFDRSEYPSFIPHLTIAYNADEDSIDWQSLIGEITFDRIEVAFAEEKHIFALGRIGETVSDGLDVQELSSLQERVQLLEVLIGESMQREVARSDADSRERVASRAT